MVPPRKPVKIVTDESSALGWVTIISVVAIIGLGVVGYMQRDRLFPGNANAETPEPQIKGRDPERIEAKLIEGRDLIVARKFAEGAALLQKLGEPGDAPQPMRNWIDMNAGLAFYLAGKPQEARAMFQKIVKRGPYKAAKDPKLPIFFLETAKLAAGEAPVPADTAKDFDKNNYESFALLTFGIMDWDLGDFDNAGALFRQFTSASPDEVSYMWLRRFRPLADGYAETYSTVQSATEAAKDAKNPEQKKAVLAMISKAKQKLGSQASLGRRLDDLETELKTQVAASDAEMAKQEAALVAADKKVLDDVKERVAGFVKEFRLAEAQQVAFTATVEADKAKEELATILKRTEWLAGFKSTLVDDINSKGWKEPVKKKDGTPVPGGLSKATDPKVTTLVRGAEVSFPWPDLSHESILAMAQGFMKGASDVPDRQWQMGVFLVYDGQRAEGAALMKEAAKAKPEYQAALAKFPEVEAP